MAPFLLTWHDDNVDSWDGDGYRDGKILWDGKGDEIIGTGLG